MGRLQLLLQYHRRLSEDVAEEKCKSDCGSDKSCYESCMKKLLSPPQTPHPNKAHKFLIIALTVFAVTFVALCFYILYFKVYLNWRASRRSASLQPPQTDDDDDDETHDDLLDENHGPVVDHHIWYINTVGLQPSIISAITVCKFKKGDGLVEGTECSVCLSEFQEDDTLRLLPKCNHAFHVPCIDTWLRSHTNCPMCRAPIVKCNTAGESSSSSTTPDSITDNSAVSSDTQVEVLRDNGETERELEGVLERRIGIEPIRRSVSLDSVSAFKISQIVANFSIEEESRGNSDARMGKQKDSRMRIVSRRVSRTESLRRFVQGSSSIARSLQIGPVSFKRSFSCSGKFLLPRSS